MTDGYTALCVVPEGIVLYEQHLARLGIRGTALEQEWLRFARDAAPGTYGVRTVAGALKVEVRGRSQLVDGMPVRFLPSPFSGVVGPQAKRPAPTAYDTVRVDGVATLLTSADGKELYESCRTAVLSWDGRRLVAVPADRPRIASVTELALDAAGVLLRAPILAGGTSPLMLVNAVKGVCLPAAPGRAPMPPEAVEQVFAVLRRSTTRPC